MNDEMRAAVKDLHALGRSAPEVKHMIRIITDAEDVDLSELAGSKPEMFWEFYESCYSMIAELGEGLTIEDAGWV